MSRRQTNILLGDGVDPDRDALFEAVCQRVDSRSLSVLGNNSRIPESHGVRYELSQLCRAGRVPSVVSSRALEACRIELWKREPYLVPDSEGKEALTATARRLFAGTILLLVGGEAENRDCSYVDTEADSISSVVECILELDLDRYGNRARALLAWRVYDASRKTQELPLFAIADSIICSKMSSTPKRWKDCLTSDYWALIANALSNRGCAIGVGLEDDEWLFGLIGKGLIEQRWRRLLA
jgi:hypothetical protein